MPLERWGHTVVRAAAGEIRAVSLLKTLLLPWDGREFCLSPSLVGPSGRPLLQVKFCQGLYWEKHALHAW